MQGGERAEELLSRRKRRRRQWRLPEAPHREEERQQRRRLLLLLLWKQSGLGRRRQAVSVRIHPAAAGGRATGPTWSSKQRRR
ncbi:Hypothetical predicted protein [Podarcis lilfordi]|uniref:Uncharacterized protein n=1 Tax=Podarcis lilfordi TaxID=74358 RepID=A0AA35KZ57_9SAUR|nr:Hypothetical predicted protein [Podarcis lilfordi]